MSLHLWVSKAPKSGGVEADTERGIAFWAKDRRAAQAMAAAYWQAPAGVRAFSVEEVQSNWDASRGELEGAKASALTNAPYRVVQLRRPIPEEA